MKFNRHILLLFLSVVAASLFVSCGAKPKYFDIDLIVGKWVSGTEYYRYDSDGTGITWDTSDDVSEEEGQLYKWEYNSDDNSLTLMHQMEMGGVIPKYYTLQKLTDNELVYKDKYNDISSFVRVQ